MLGSYSGEEQTKSNRIYIYMYIYRDIYRYTDYIYVYIYNLYICYIYTYILYIVLCIYIYICINSLSPPTPASALPLYDPLTALESGISEVASKISLLTALLIRRGGSLRWSRKFDCKTRRFLVDSRFAACLWAAEESWRAAKRCSLSYWWRGGWEMCDIGLDDAIGVEDALVILWKVMIRRRLFFAVSDVVFQSDSYLDICELQPKLFIGWFVSEVSATLILQGDFVVRAGWPMNS